MISLLLLGTENSSDGGAQGSYPEKRSSGVQLRAWQQSSPGAPFHSSSDQPHLRHQDHLLGLDVPKPGGLPGMGPVLRDGARIATQKDSSR